MITEEYRRILEQEHAKKPWGTMAYMMGETIDQWRRRVGTEQVLDYGCGSNHGYRTWLNEQNISIDLQEYDPGIAEYSKWPEPADLVICIDVLEHVEPQYVDRVLDHLKILAGQAVLLTVTTTLAKRVLSNGWNAHISTHNPTWWQREFESRWRTHKIHVMPDGVRFWGWRL